MFGSTILEVAIGLIFLYLLLSLACSALKELIEGFLKQRAGDLEQALTNLLGGPLKGQLAAHGLVQGLATSGKPSYIPAQTFALALMDAIAGSGAGGANNALPNPALPPAPPSPALLAGAAALPTPYRGALTSLIDSAGPDAAKVRENIEAWYNAAMDRVTGAYKRRTQVIIMALGAVIVSAINADSINVATVLSNNAALRSSLVASAQEYAKTQTQPPPASPPAKAPAEQLQDVTKQIGSLGLPLGWNEAPMTAAAWITKLFGLLLTAAAISFGTPFWFDVLNKVINVRAAVKPDTNKAK